MDPKTAQNLDPKLREVYERVMGTSSTPPANSSAPAAQSAQVEKPQTPVPPSNSTLPPLKQKSAVDYNALNSQAINTSAPVTPKVSAPTTTAYTATTQSTSPTFGVVNPSESGKSSPASNEKKGSILKKLLLLVGIPLFILIYTLIWVIVFGVELPFALPI